MGRTQNYEQSTIYHIRNIVTKEIIYVGSTTNFPARKYRHKSDYNRNCNLQVYCDMRENGGFNQYEIIPIRILNLKNKTELLIAENEEQDRINLLQLKDVLPVLENEKLDLEIIKPNIENVKLDIENETPLVNPLNHIIKPTIENVKLDIENEKLLVCKIVKPTIENVRVKNEIEGNSRCLGIVENVKLDIENEKPDVSVYNEIEGNSLGIVENVKPDIENEKPDVRVKNEIEGNSLGIVENVKPDMKNENPVLEIDTSVLENENRDTIFINDEKRRQEIDEMKTKIEYELRHFFDRPNTSKYTFKRNLKKKLNHTIKRPPQHKKVRFNI